MRPTILALACLFLLSACAATATRDQIAQTLKDNPQLVYDALKTDKAQLLDLLDQAVNEREQAERRESLVKNLANPLVPDLSGDRPFLGAADAPVTIVEYSDFLCPYCAHASLTMQELMRRHPGKIRLFFKHYPAKPGSLEPAATFEAIAMQSKEQAWKFAELAFANQEQLAGGGGKGLADLVSMLTLDEKRLKKDSESRAVLGRIQSDVLEAKRFGVEGTPSFLVNGVLVRGALPLADFEELLGLLGVK